MEVDPVPTLPMALPKDRDKEKEDEKDNAPKNGKRGPRKRVSQACDRCRTRKDKCDGKKPSCSTCIANGRQCAYDANVKKRGLPEGYVRGMEKLWGLALQEVHGVEDRLLSTTSGNGSNGSHSFLGTWNDEYNSELLVNAWNESKLSSELHRLLSFPDPGAENGKRRRATFSQSQPEKKFAPSGPVIEDEQRASGWDESKLEIRPPTQNGHRSSVPNNIQVEPAYESILSPQVTLAASVDTPAPVSDVSDLPSEAWHLLDVYFSYTHTWLPILEKIDILRTSYQYSQNKQEVQLLGPGSGNHAALWATIAYAKYQHRAINNIPHAQGPVAEMVWTAERMYTQARNFIPNEDGFFEIGHVQALIILALTNLGIGYPKRAWLLIGKAVSIAIDLRLDRSGDDPLAPLYTKSRTRHVFLGCFVVDTLIAARSGHRPHLRAEDVASIGSVEEDGLEEWDPWGDCLSVRRMHTGNARGPASILSTFNRLIQVLQISNEAACVVDTHKMSQASITLLEKLHAWSSAQASSLYFDSAAMNTEQAMSLLPHHYNLHLVYFNTLAIAQLMSCNDDKESANLEPSTRSARQLVTLLKLHANSFGLLIVPPTFEFFTKTAYDVLRKVNESIQSTQIMLNDWKYVLDHCLEAMAPAWPILESFKELESMQTNRAVSMDRRDSQVAFDLISGIPQTGHDANANPLGSKQNHPPEAPRSFSQSSPGRTSSFGQGGGQTVTPNFQQNQIQLNANDTWANQVQRFQPTQPRLKHTRSFGSELELDPAFQEFATMDATKWSSNWDQSLQNLGFTDPDSMNRDFYTMSREPDPLFQNNVFQQLVANTNAESIDVFDASMFGMGTTSFGEAEIGDQQGIEAGQILQSLSGAGVLGASQPNS